MQNNSPNDCAGLGWWGGPCECAGELDAPAPDPVLRLARALARLTARELSGVAGAAAVPSAALVSVSSGSVLAAGGQP